jgi:hypothetical protein
MKHFDIVSKLVGDRRLSAFTVYDTDPSGGIGTSSFDGNASTGMEPLWINA